MGRIILRGSNCVHIQIRTFSFVESSEILPLSALRPPTHLATSTMLRSALLALCLASASATPSFANSTVLVEDFFMST